MRVERGASQILFGLLPGQTADLEGRIWRVTHWVDPVATPLDQDSVRQALISGAAPWAQQDNDDGLTAELRARANVEVVSAQHGPRRPGRAVPAAVALQGMRQASRDRDDRCACGVRTTGADAVRRVPHRAARPGSPISRGVPTHPTQSPFVSPERPPPGNCASSARVCNTTLSQGFPVPGVRLRRRRDERHRPPCGGRLLAAFRRARQPA